MKRRTNRTLSVAMTTSAAAIDERRWQAVLTRDAAADPDFVYAVATTGICCRPSCPSRRPRRTNVRFFVNAAAAAAAGYRPCRRCRPDADHADAHTATISAACRRIESAETAPRLAELAQRAGMSPHHFQRVFKAATGLTPAQYARGCRAERLRTGLGDGHSVTAAMHAAGYSSSSRLYADAPAALGMSPSRYRRGGAGLVIRYALTNSVLGRVLVAATATGVCAILLGDADAPLENELRARFRHAELTRDDAGFADWVEAVVAGIAAPRRGIDLPLDIQGTAFQQRVWHCLRDIEPGTTTSYADIARRLGAPQAVRAVAGACAANPLAVAIPCHRVVRGDGSLGGYRWGTARKRALLKRESKE